MDMDLARYRILFVGTGINEDAAQRIVSALLLLNAQDPSAPIELYINSAGGNVLDGLAIYDAMQAIEAPVATYCLGCAASMGAVLLAAGTPGMRYATPNARIMIHRPSAPMGSGSGTAEVVRQMGILAEALDRTLAGILARHTGLKLQRIRADMRRTRWFTPEQAMRYGLIDDILPFRKIPAAGRP